MGVPNVGGRGLGGGSGGGGGGGGGGLGVGGGGGGGQVTGRGLEARLSFSREFSLYLDHLRAAGGIHFGDLQVDQLADRGFRVAVEGGFDLPGRESPDPVVVRASITVVR